MQTTFTIITILATYIICGMLTPFPYWTTYFLLWKATLTFREPTIHWKARTKQITYLSRHLMLMPLWVFFWYLDDLLFPGYKKKKITPVFIIGQPRSGSTLLHRTLAADTETFFAIRHIEWRLPFITIQRLIDITLIKSILGRINYWSNSEAGLLAAKMHPNTLADWEEDGIFFEERFVHHFFLFLRFPYPCLLKRLDAFDELPKPSRQHILNIHHKVLQKVLYLRGGETLYYLSKEVTSHNKVSDLKAMYPDGKFLFILRKSHLFMSSLLELVRYSTLAKTGIDPINITGWKKTIISRMEQDCNLLLRISKNTVPDNDQLRISSSFFTDQISLTVETIYKKLDLKISPAFKAYLCALNLHQHNRNRGYDYQQCHYSGFEEYDRFVNHVDSEFSALNQFPDTFARTTLCSSS